MKAAILELARGTAAHEFGSALYGAPAARS